MRIVLQDQWEELAFQVYAKKIGIPIGKWYEDQWVNAFSVIKGVSKNDALMELRSRDRDYRPCCCV